MLFLFITILKLFSFEFILGQRNHYVHTSLRDEGIYSADNVLLHVAEAVLKHTMSHDHSHFSFYFFLLFD
jgi:hypothetical protein